MNKSIFTQMATALIFLTLFSSCGVELERGQKVQNVNPPATPGVIPVDFDPALGVIGSFGPSHCFLNKFIKKFTNEDVYTIANITFNNDGTGQTAFALYSDSICQNETTSGALPITYEIVNWFGSVAIIKVIQQNDLENPEDTITMYHAAFIDPAGIYMDLDYSDEDSGPYEAEPISDDISDFLADPKTIGKLLNKS